jgi:hypothetical protein
MKMLEALRDSGGKMRPQKHPWEGPANELVPTVKAEDMKAAWRLMQDTRAEHSEAIAIGRGLWKQWLSRGADIDAVTYRTSMLGLLYGVLQDADSTKAEPELQKQAERLSTFNKFDDALFKVMAQIRLYWLRKDGPTNGFPFDVEEFLTLVERARPAS